ncbi:MAG: hypothetical protein WAU07_00125 [Microgenomates group bacterium]
MKEKAQKKPGMPLATAVTGVAVGVGLAVAGVMAMRDTATKKKVEKGINQLKSKSKAVSKKIEKTVSGLKSKSKKASDDVAKKANVTKKEVTDKIDRTKLVAKKVIKELKKA